MGRCSDGLLGVGVGGGSGRCSILVGGCRWVGVGVGGCM